MKHSLSRAALIAGCISSLGCRETDPELALESKLRGLPWRIAVLASRLTHSGNELRFGFHVDEVMPAASLSKLIIAITVAGWLKDHHFSVEETIQASRHVLKLAWSETWGLNVPNRVAISTLVRSMISNSDNFAANSLINVIGLDAIYREAQNLHLRFPGVHGYFVDEAASSRRTHNVTTARDMAAALQSIAIGVSDLDERGKVCRLILDSMKKQSDARILKSAISWPAVVANKTGEITHVLNDAGIVFRPFAEPVLLVLLSEGIPELNSNAYFRAVDTLKGTGRMLYATCA